jgi:hypothetical protein
MAVFREKTAIVIMAPISGQYSNFFNRSATRFYRTFTELQSIKQQQMKLWLTDYKGNQRYTKDGEHATENRLGVDSISPHDLRALPQHLCQRSALWMNV